MIVNQLLFFYMEFLIASEVDGSQEAFQLLAENIKEPFVPGEDEHIVERSAIHLMFKKLIATETQRTGELFCFLFPWDS